MTSASARGRMHRRDQGADQRVALIRAAQRHSDQGRVQDVDDDKRGEPGDARSFQRHLHKLQTKPGNGGVQVLVAHVDGRIQRRDLGFGRADLGLGRRALAPLRHAGVVVICSAVLVGGHGFCTAAARPCRALIVPLLM